jgi:hypothetical protein
MVKITHSSASLLQTPTSFNVMIRIILFCILAWFSTPLQHSWQALPAFLEQLEHMKLFSLVRGYIMMTAAV